MKSIILAMFLALSVLSPAAWSTALAQDAPAASPAAVVDELKGTVTASKPGGQPRQLTLNEGLSNSETVSTGPDASCQLRLADGTLLSLGESSTATILDAAYDPDHPDMASAICRLGRGTYRCLTGEAAAVSPEKFRLETPLAVIGVRGTELGVLVGEKTLETGVFSGGPGFVTGIEGGKAVRLRSGQFVEKASGRPFGQVAKISGRMRSLIGAVPMRLSSDAPFAAPGRIKGRGMPPSLARKISGGPGGGNDYRPGNKARKAFKNESGRASGEKGGKALTREGAETKQQGKAKPESAGKKADGKSRSPRDVFKEIFGRGGDPGGKLEEKGSSKGGSGQKYQPGPDKEKGERGGGRF